MTDREKLVDMILSCGDCVHCGECSKNKRLTMFSPKNEAYCKAFELKEPPKEDNHETD